MTSPGSPNKYGANVDAFTAAANVVHRETDNIVAAVNQLQSQSAETLPMAAAGQIRAAGFSALDELAGVVMNRAQQLHLAADHHTTSANQTAAMDQQHQAAIKKVVSSMAALNTTPTAS